MGTAVTTAIATRGRLFAGITAALLAFFISLPLQARPLEEVVKDGRVTIFVYKDYAPYSWHDGERLTGVDVDIARAIAKELGVTAEFLVRDADENVDDDLRVNLWKGDLIHKKSADLMMHVPIDPVLAERNERVVLFGPYFNEEVAVAYDTAKLADLSTFGSFVTRPIAVEVDTVSDFFLSNAFRGQLQKSIRRHRTFMEAVDVFEAGDVVALMGSRAQTEWLAKRGMAQSPPRNIKIAQPPMPGIVREYWPIGLGVKSNSRSLARAVEQALGKLLASGAIAKRFETYGITYLEPVLKPVSQ